MAVLNGSGAAIKWISRFNPFALPATSKNSAGYHLTADLDWVDLIAGSEGTLGIVTEAEVQLFPEPAAVLSGVVFFPYRRVGYGRRESLAASQ